MANLTELTSTVPPPPTYTPPTLRRDQYAPSPLITETEFNEELTNEIHDTVATVSEEPTIPEMTVDERRRQSIIENKNKKMAAKKAYKEECMRIKTDAKKLRDEQRQNAKEIAAKKRQESKELAQIKKQHALNQKNCRKLHVLMDSLSYMLDKIGYHDMRRAIKQMNTHALWKINDSARIALVCTLDDIFNFNMGTKYNACIPKKVWKIIPRRKNKQKRMLQGNPNDPLYLYFCAMFSLDAYGNTLDSGSQVVAVLFKAINQLTCVHVSPSGVTQYSQDVWPQYFANNGWCLAYHLMYVTMSLLTGDMEEKRMQTYIKRICTSSDQKEKYCYRHVKLAEKLFHSYLRFTNMWSSTAPQTDSPSRMDVELHHLVHFHMLRMFFQHVWPAVVSAPYVNYPVVGTEEEVKALLTRYPLPHLFMFCQGNLYLATSMTFPVNMPRLALLFESNSYQPDLALEMTSAFVRHARSELDNNYIQGLSSPYITRETCQLRSNLLYHDGCLDQFNLAKLSQDLVMRHERVWQAVLADFNDYMMHCGFLEGFLPSTDSPLELYERAKQDANKTTTLSKIVETDVDDLVPPAPAPALTIDIATNSEVDGSTMV